MKVVINRCYGGYGLSKDALTALAATPCEHVKHMEPPDYYGKNWEEQMAEDGKRNARLFWTLFINGKVIIDEHRPDDTRACEHLVAVVEKLGPAASGSLSKLVVVDVPDGVKFFIDEYDGIETVDEEHRSWS